jgi:large subunit ribosomal protein L25
MQRKTLQALDRTEKKTANARRLRKAGKIPAVIYGHNPPETISVDEKEFSKKFHSVSENTIINIKTEKKDYDVLVRDYQEDMLSGRIIHIDFYEIEQGKELTTNVPVHLEGAAPGVREGGILEQRLHTLEIQCLPQDLPEYFTVDVSSLTIGDSVHVGALEVPKGVQILNMEDQVICVVTTQKLVLEPEEEEEEGEEALGEEGEAEEGEAAEKTAETESEEE